MVGYSCRISSRSLEASFSMISHSPGNALGRPVKSVNQLNNNGGRRLVMESHFNGLGMHLGNLSRLSNARTRSISAENPDGAKGRGGMATEGTGAYVARELGQGWKVSPSIVIVPRSTIVL